MTGAVPRLGALDDREEARGPARPSKLKNQVRDNCPEAQCPEVQCPMSCSPLASRIVSRRSAPILATGHLQMMLAIGTTRQRRPAAKQDPRIIIERPVATLFVKFGN